MAESSLLSLLHLADATLPIGGFAHSYGLETYVQNGKVKDSDTAKNFIVQMLAQNIHYTDAAFVSLVYYAAQQNDWEKVLQLDEECSAVKLPREIRQASQKLGMRLLKVFEPLCSHHALTHYKQLIHQQKAWGNYCIVYGMVAAVTQIKLAEALTGFYYNAATTMVTNCVKLIPLGQQDGQQLLFSLFDLIQQLVKTSLCPDTDKIGVSCTGFDIRSMQHEVLYSRLYMS